MKQSLAHDSHPTRWRDLIENETTAFALISAFRGRDMRDLAVAGGGYVGGAEAEEQT
jgi:hypothetical protein